jgi:predicted transcriptional regulator of viral defense system
MMQLLDRSIKDGDRDEHTSNKFRGMLISMDRATKQTDLPGLDALALEQAGYFDREDAHQHGIGDDLLHYYVRTGRFERLAPGIYRLRIAPRGTRDELQLAWIWTNYRGVISHDSALAHFGLSDVLPQRVHLTVPPSFRKTSAPFALHWSQLREDEVMNHEGVLVTTPARSIVDAASAGTGPEQIEMAVRQAIERGLASPDQLRQAASRPRYRHRRRVLPQIEAAIRHATS